MPKSLRQQTDDLEAEEALSKPGWKSRVIREGDELSGDNDSESGLPAIVRLDEFLAQPDEPVEYRINGLWPIGGRVILAAQYKAGKTTLAGNVIRSLVDGVLFLGQFPVGPVDSVLLIDDELDERPLRRWLRDYGIEHTDRVSVVPLRGRVGTFDLLNPAVRAEWAEHIKSAGRVDVLVFDALRPVLDALGLSEDKDSGRFLVAFDALLREAGIGEALVVHHMGHANERSRGDSRLRDWPDAEWKLVRATTENDDPRVPRFFSAYGRDVDVAEGSILFEPETRILTLAGGSRADAKLEDVVGKVVEAVDKAGRIKSQNGLESAVDARREDVRKAWPIAVERELIGHFVEGSGHNPPHVFVSLSHTLRPLRPTSPGANGRTPP